MHSTFYSLWVMNNAPVAAAAARRGAPTTKMTIEGVSDDVVMLVACVIVIILAFTALFNRSRSSQATLHPDFVDDLRTFQERSNDTQNSNNTNTNSSLPSSPASTPRLRRQDSINTCPICLDDCQTEILTNCGHSFCGACIIDFWQHSGSPRGTLPCPCCRTPLTMLHGASPESFQGTEGLLVQSRVQHFNRTCSLQPRTWNQMMNDAPVLLRILANNPYLVMRSFRILYMFAAALLSVLYLISPIDLIPELAFGVFGLFDDVVVIIISLIFIAETVRRILL